MRSGGYTFHQSLSPESAIVVKQAISFARRRGHAQVTPLHVAATILASSTGLLKRACLKSNSHPLQCRALELCFNVALNRLPTSPSMPLVPSHSHLPSLSNALIAAFKRAQAHQRRGSIENQHQPVLALKVEIEQLILSILDDPSISRVMREAGFSSTQVKDNVEQAVSSDTCPAKDKTKFSVLGSKDSVKNDEVMCIFEALMNKKTRNTVIVSECSSRAERMVRRVIERFEKKEVPFEMKLAQFINIPLSTLQNVSKQEFEVRLGELRSLVKTCAKSGIVLYLGNLDWVSEFWSEFRQRRKGFYSCPVECMMMELSRLINGSAESRRLWIMGTADFKTYAKCKSGHPSLETLWSLYPFTIPDDSLALCLSLDSGVHHSISKELVLDESHRLFQRADVKKLLVCCSDCSVNFKREAKDSTVVKQLSIDEECERIKDLCKKWNSICASVHKRPHFLEKKFDFSPSSPSTSISSNDQSKSKLQRNLLNWPVIFEHNSDTNDHQILGNDNETEVSKPIFTNYFAETKPDLLSNPNSSPNSASSSEASGDNLETRHKFKELNSENLNILCRALGEHAPLQRDIIPEIAKTVLKCRSGMVRGKRNATNNTESREDSWLLFFGHDSNGKEAVARELAKTVFGSYDTFNPIQLSSFSSTRDDSSEEVSNKKRVRKEQGNSLFERFLDSVRDNPSRLFFIEDSDQLDRHSWKGFRKAMESGIFKLLDGEEVVFKDAIVIFSCESFISASRACSTSSPSLQIEGSEECGFLDLNVAAEEDWHNGENGILESVDGQFLFEIQVL